MKISIIVAISDNYVIGKDNKLLWYISDDLKRFKKLTNGKVVIMGQKTYESLPIKPLPNRINIIISDNYNLKYENCIVVNGINESLIKAEYWSDDDEIFIIGGGSIYSQFLDKADKLYITKVHENFVGDTFFPEIKEEDWVKTHEENHYKNDKNEYDFTYLIYEKKK